MKDRDREADWLRRVADMRHRVPENSGEPTGNRPIDAPPDAFRIRGLARDGRHLIESARR